MGRDQRSGGLQEPIEVLSRLNGLLKRRLCRRIWRVFTRSRWIQALSLIILISSPSLFLLILILSCFHWDVKPVLTAQSPKAQPSPQHFHRLVVEKTEENTREKKRKNSMIFALCSFFFLSKRNWGNPTNPRYSNTSISSLEALVLKKSQWVWKSTIRVKMAQLSQYPNTGEKTQLTAWEISDRIRNLFQLSTVKPKKPRNLRKLC